MRHAGGVSGQDRLEELAEEYLATGTVQPVVMGGHPRKEWVAVPATADDSLWAELLDEAFTYVESLAAP